MELGALLHEHHITQHEFDMLQDENLNGHMYECVAILGQDYEKVYDLARGKRINIQEFFNCGRQ
jgi:hypothetical protein